MSKSKKPHLLLMNWNDQVRLLLLCEELTRLSEQILKHAVKKQKRVT